MKINLFIFSFLFITSYCFANYRNDSLIYTGENKTETYENRVSAYTELTKIYCRFSIDSSLLFGNKALELAKGNKDYNKIVKTYNNIGITYSLAGEMNKGLECYKDALSSAKESKSDTLISYALLNIGNHFMRLEKMDTALIIFRNALAATEKQTTLTLKTMCLMAASYSMLGERPTARITLQEALEINKEVKNKFYAAKIVFVIGTTYHASFNYDKAIKYYMQALELSIPLKDNKLIQYNYDGIIRIYNTTQQYEKAIETTKESLKYYENETNQRATSSMYRQLGSSYSALGKKDTALIYFHKSLDLILETHDSVGISLVYSRIAKLHIETENHLLAEEYLLKSLKINENYPHFFNQSYCYLFLGDVYMKMSTIDWQEQSFNNELNIGLIDKQYEKKALQLYTKSLEFSTKYHIEGATMDAYFSLYDYYKKKNNYKEALFYYEKHIQINDTINSQESKIAIEELTTKYEVNKKDNEILLLEKDQKLKNLLFQQEQEKNKSKQELLMLGFGLILLVLFILIIFYRLRQKNKMNAIENKSLKVETQLLRSQMNPHFIFNSLNSIQSFISGNETIDAERYLSKFSKLMRLILDNSRHGFIVFENEINTLNLYLELEKLRFDNSFTYSINFNDIDEEFTLVPPMLAQPYIENAVLHGIRKVENGRIDIEYKQEGNKIICTIDDNGIGREKSMTDKVHQASDMVANKKRKSLGIKVTQERIDLLAKEFGLDLIIKIVDKKDANNKPLGTKIVIEMPWKN